MLVLIPGIPGIDRRLVFSRLCSYDDFASRRECHVSPWIPLKTISIVPGTLFLVLLRVVNQAKFAEIQNSFCGALVIYVLFYCTAL